MLFCCWFIWQQFIRKTRIDPNGKAVYITGCDSGFGHSTAIVLAKKGFLVFAGCLNPRGQGALSLRESGGANVEILDLDVTNQEKVTACADSIERTLEHLDMAGLWALYNNAGFATAGEIEWCSMTLYQKQVDVNLWGTVRVTKSVLPLIRKAKGRVVTVTSGISRSAHPGRSAYCISKYATEGFMDTLRYEMAKFGVKCCTIVPGNFTGATEIFAQIGKQIEETVRNISPAIRADYGDKYIEQFRNHLIGYQQDGSAGVAASTDLVIQAVKDAIMSKHPRTRYKPMQPGWLVWDFLASILPYDVTDKYIAFWAHKLKPRHVAVR